MPSVTFHLLKPKYFNLLLWGLSALLLFLGNTQLTPISFPDSAAYLRGGDHRPWLPYFIFQNVSQGNLLMIVIVQKVLHLGVLAYALLVLTRYFDKPLLKQILAIGIVLIFSWWNIAGYTNLILSESLTYSFLFLSIIFIIHYNQTYQLYTLFGFLIASILAAGARDHVSALMLVPTILLLIQAVIKKRHIMFVAGVMFILSSLHFVRTKAVISSKRHSPVVGNVIINRILTNSVWKAEFIEKGMPYHEKLDTLIGHSSWGLDNYLGKTAELASFNNWLIEESYEVYTSFLLSHPTYTFVGPFYDKKVYQALHAPSRYPKTPSNMFTRLIYLVLPLFTIRLLGVLLLLTLLIRRKTTGHWWSAAIIFSMALANFFLSYHGDSNEISRHLIAVSPLLQLAGLLLCVQFGAYISSRWTRPLQNPGNV